MNVVCPQCKVTNRVCSEREGKPVCGKCKATLEPRAPGYPIEVNDASFDTEVLKVGIPVLLDLWGASCPPCRRLEPELKALAKELAGKVRVAKLNVERNAVIPQKLGIRGVPTLIMYRGSELGRTSGFMPLAELRRFVARFAGS